MSEPLHYTIDGLATRWACHRVTVERLIESGKLRAFRVGRGWRVSAEEVGRYEKQEAVAQPAA